MHTLYPSPHLAVIFVRKTYISSGIERTTKIFLKAFFAYLDSLVQPYQKKTLKFKMPPILVGRFSKEALIPKSSQLEFVQLK